MPHWPWIIVLRTDLVPSHAVNRLCSQRERERDGSHLPAAAADSSSNLKQASRQSVNGRHQQTIEQEVQRGVQELGCTCPACPRRNRQLHPQSILQEGSGQPASVLEACCTG